MLQAVIFDFDGVIADSDALHYESLNVVFNRHGTDVSKNVHWEKYLGYSARENIEAVGADYGMEWDSAMVQRLLEEKKVVFKDLVVSGANIINGVATFIQRLTDAGIRLAICSGALRCDIDLMLAETDFRDAFEVIVTADDVVHSKPDPEGFLMALDKLNQTGDDSIKAKQCVVIEDSSWGLDAATAARMRSIAVTNTYSRSQLAQYSQKVIDRLDELTIDDLSALCG